MLHKQKLHQEASLNNYSILLLNYIKGVADALTAVWKHHNLSWNRIQVHFSTKLHQAACTTLCVNVSRSQFYTTQLDAIQCNTWARAALQNYKCTAHLHKSHPRLVSTRAMLLRCCCNVATPFWLHKDDRHYLHEPT